MWYFTFGLLDFGYAQCTYNTNRLVLELVISIIPIELDLSGDEKSSNQQSETRLI